MLRDGATAQYGSDAIAGVMNFGMRNDRNNLELQARYGQFYDHGHTKLDSGRSRQIAGTAGIGIGATGFIDVAGEWYKDDGTSTGETRPVALIFAQEFPDLAASAAQLSAAGADLGLVAALTAGRAWSTPGSTSPSNSQLYFTGIGAYNHANESFNYRSPITRDRVVDVAGNTTRLSAQRRILRPVLPDALSGRQRDLRRGRLCP